MKRKTNKKSGIIAAVVGLSAVSLVSVGFASWIISGGDTAEINGSIAVDEVSDARFLIEKEAPYAPEVDYGTGNASIVFGAPTVSNAGWLTNDSSAKENLTADVVFYVANLTGKTKGTDYDLDATIEATGDESDEFATAVGHGLVELPVITKNVSFTVDGDVKHDTTINGTTYKFTKVTLQLQFKWGVYFGKDGNDVTTNTNPYSFYNAKSAQGYVNGVSGTTWADDAKAKLEEIHAADGANFKVTLKTFVHTN